MLYKLFVFGGSAASQQKGDVQPMLGQWWVTVCAASPTLNPNGSKRLMFAVSELAAALPRPDVDLMLDHRQRRCSNIKTLSGERLRGVVLLCGPVQETWPLYVQLALVFDLLALLARLPLIAQTYRRDYR